MRRYEVESLLKSFALFFVLITAIYGLFLYQSYADKRHALDTRILQQMRIFSFDPTTQAFELSFVPKEQAGTLLELQHEPDRVYGTFVVPTEDNFRMQVILPIEKYREQLMQIRGAVLRGAVLYLFLITVISLMLAYYSLQPIRRAMRLNKEFIRDILHDVNTPIASIAVNLKLLEKRFGHARAIDRIKNNIETLGVLRENLHAYLGKRQGELSEFALHGLVAERLEYFRVLYPNVTFDLAIPRDVRLRTHRNAFVRILDNLIGNAAKYNVPQGSVTVRWEKTRLTIADTGRGIRDPGRAFERHYKEGERGMGLGLHIVQSLCRELKIGLTLESEVGVGTQVHLACSEMVLRVSEK